MKNRKSIYGAGAVGNLEPGGRSRWLFHIFRLMLGLVFIYASYDKILHPQAFALAVYNYQFLPDAVINLVALILPWLELFLGLCLLFSIWLPGATVTAVSLLVVFLGALVFNQIRGLDMHCGCFSTETKKGPAGLGTVLRDLGFLVISLYLLIVVFLFKHRNVRSFRSKSV
jgi:hypothetical protein